MFSGSIVAIVTPYSEDGRVDLETLQSLIKWHGESGSDGVVLCGTTGEGWALSRAEKCAIMKAAKEVSKIPLIMNAGTCSTVESVAIAGDALDAGVDGILAIVPYYNKPSYRGCQVHFTQIANHSLLSSGSHGCIIHS